MSDTPSPSKSPTPATLYACSSTLTTACSVERSPDFQLVLPPVLVLRHRMSDTPSPFNSPTPTMVHASLVPPTTPSSVERFLASQIVFLPVQLIRASCHERCM